MPWMLFVLAVAGCFAAGVSFYIYRQSDRVKFLGFFFAALFFVTVNIAHILNPILTGDIVSFLINQAIEWGHVYCIALILSALMVFIRESKPEFSRFPIIYAILPVIVVISYLLAYNTIILKYWLLNIYEGGAAIVIVLMYGLYNYREEHYLTVFIGSVLFMLTFLAHIMLPLSYSIYARFLLAISIITFFSGYLIMQRHYDQQFE